MSTLARQVILAFKPQAVIDNGVPQFADFASTAWMAVVLLAVRTALERIVLPPLAKRLGKGGKATAVFDNFYVVAWSLATEALAIYVTLNINGGCKPWATDACLTAWPHHPVHVLQKWYMIAMFQLYAHEMLGALLGLQKIKTDMVVHHLATMGLISTAYALNLNRYGIMWQALFDTSNPLLHAAKGLHAAHVPQLEGLKWTLFKAFALVFFVARVAAAPYSILWPAFTRSLDVLPRDWALFLIALMLVVCGMQWVWFSRIVAMAAGKGGKDGDDDDGGSQKKKQ